jgi:hypothetical protein
MEFGNVGRQSFYTAVAYIPEDNSEHQNPLIHYHVSQAFPDR